MSLSTKIKLMSYPEKRFVSSELFGGFLEHMGRAVYGGVYDPMSDYSDEDGLRDDVQEALHKMRYSLMRYPGGNFVSGYHWRDGVGPRAERPTVRDLAWNSIEPNYFGTDEFLGLCKKMGWIPMLTVNLGTGTPEEAANWVEYCNGEGDSFYAQLRRKNGILEPYKVEYWCLGNEMDGEWQIGHLSAEDYAKKALQAAEMMKLVDPGIKLIACGTSSYDSPTYARWDRVILDSLWEHIDYLSVHRYLGKKDDISSEEYLFQPESVEEQIIQWESLCRYMGAEKRSSKKIYLSMDEWNIWYKEMDMNGEQKFAPRLLEEIFTLEDALVFAGYFNCFIRQAHFVKIANLAQILNVIAPVIVEKESLLYQSIFHVFTLFSQYQTGESLLPIQQGAKYKSDSSDSYFYLDIAAIRNMDRVAIFMVNRSLNESINADLELSDFNIQEILAASIITSEELTASNSFEAGNIVQVNPFRNVQVVNGKGTFSVPSHSFCVIEASLSHKDNGEIKI